MNEQQKNLTPRTDVSWFPHTDGGITVQAVRADFARELERELRKWRDLAALRAGDVMRDVMRQQEDAK